MQKFTLDAENKKVGRVASEAAKILMGKNSPAFARNIVPDVRVDITNVAKADVTEKRKETLLKATASGYPGDLKRQTVGQVISKKGRSELFRKAVSGMLPRNKLRNEMMKHLTISE